MNNQNIKNVLFLSLSVLAVFIIILTVIIAKNKIAGETKNTITVSGVGDVSARPDLAFTVFSLIVEAKTVTQALDENSKKMNLIINFVKSQGVGEKDLKTVNFNISPRYEWQDKWSRRILVGYEAQQSLQVKIRDMAKIGQIIEGAAEAGANQIGDLQFTIDKEDELKAEARIKAINGAKTKARELAKELGVRLGKIINFQESNNFPSPILFLGKTAEAGGSQAPQIETGENKIESTVSITYEIR